MERAFDSRGSGGLWRLYIAADDRFSGVTGQEWPAVEHTTEHSFVPEEVLHERKFITERLKHPHGGITIVSAAVCPLRRSAFPGPKNARVNSSGPIRMRLKRHPTVKSLQAALRGIQLPLKSLRRPRENLLGKSDSIIRD
jgi:hypothetical protein